MTWILANTKPCPQCKCVVFGLGGRAGGWFGISACQGLAIERTVAPVAGSLCLGLDLPCHTVWMHAKGKKTSVHTAALFLDAYALLNPAATPNRKPLQAADREEPGVYAYDLLPVSVRVLLAVSARLGHVPQPRHRRLLRLQQVWNRMVSAQGGPAVTRSLVNARPLCQLLHSRCALTHLSLLAPPSRQVPGAERLWQAQRHRVGAGKGAAVPGAVHALLATLGREQPGQGAGLSVGEFVWWYVETERDSCIPPALSLCLRTVRRWVSCSDFWSSSKSPFRS